MTSVWTSAPISLLPLGARLRQISTEVLSLWLGAGRPDARGSCRLRIAAVGDIFGRIQDPAIELPDNVYVRAFYNRTPFQHKRAPRGAGAIAGGLDEVRGPCHLVGVCA